MTDLERLRELESKATPGEWRALIDNYGEDTWPGSMFITADPAEGQAPLCDDLTQDDAAFIVAAIAHVRRELDAAASPEAEEGPTIDVDGMHVVDTGDTHLGTVRHRVGLCAKCAAPASEAASQPETLDAAWKEAEAALPEGLSFTLTRAIRPAKEGAPPTYYVSVVRPWVSDKVAMQVSGPTPTAALTAFALRLKEHTDG